MKKQNSREKRTKSTNEQTQKKEKLESDLNLFLVQILQHTRAQKVKARCLKPKWTSTTKKQKKSYRRQEKSLNKNFNFKSSNCTQQLPNDSVRVLCGCCCCLYYFSFLFVSLFIMRWTVGRACIRMRMLITMLRSRYDWARERGHKRKRFFVLFRAVQNQNVQRPHLVLCRDDLWNAAFIFGRIA